MISRKAIISVLVLCLMFCLCLLCLTWTSLWVHVTQIPVLLCCLSLKGGWGEGKYQRLWGIESTPVIESTLVMDSLRHFAVVGVTYTLSFSILRFSPSQAFQIHPSHVLGAPFYHAPSLWQQTFFYPLLSPSSPQAFPSLPVITASSIFESIGFINIFSEKMPFSLISQVRWKLICQSSLIYCAQQLVFNYGKAPVVRWRAQTEAFPFPAPSMAKLYSPSWLFF